MTLGMTQPRYRLRGIEHRGFAPVAIDRDPWPNDSARALVLVAVLVSEIRMADDDERDNLLVRLSFPHLNKQMGRIFSGAASTSPYSLRLLRFGIKYGIKNEDPRELMIR